MVKKSLKNQVVERRESPRKSLKTRVKLVLGGKERVEESRNISLTGLFLKSNQPDSYAINDPVAVSFKDESGAPETHNGKIVRKSNEGIAVMYWRDKEPPPIE